MPDILDTLVKKRCYTGMRVRVSIDRSLSWQPNKLAGSHGARFTIEDKNGLAEMVLAKKPKGAWVKITRGGGVLCYEEAGPSLIGKISNPPKLKFAKIDPNPDDMAPGKIWSGPFDGEYHHFCGDRFWISNVDNKRCHYREVPPSLKESLERFKPMGGSWVVNPWGHVFALIEPQPLPEEAAERWSRMSKEERRLLQIKQKGAGMLPIYICKWDDGWEVELEEPPDYSKPLSKGELDQMMGFLSKWSSGDESSSKEEEEVQEPEVEEEFADDSDFFEEDALNVSYSPSEN